MKTISSSVSTLINNKFNQMKANGIGAKLNQADTNKMIVDVLLMYAQDLGLAIDSYDITNIVFQSQQLPDELKSTTYVTKAA